jgi:hypothetical protein
LRSTALCLQRGRANWPSNPPGSSATSGAEAPEAYPYAIYCHLSSLAGEQVMRAGQEHPLAGQDRRVEGWRFTRWVGDSGRPNLDRPGPDGHGPRLAIAVAMALLGKQAALIARTAQKTASAPMTLLLGGARFVDGGLHPAAGGVSRLIDVTVRTLA